MGTRAPHVWWGRMHARIYLLVWVGLRSDGVLAGHHRAAMARQCYPQGIHLPCCPTKSLHRPVLLMAAFANPSTQRLQRLFVGRGPCKQRLQRLFVWHRPYKQRLQPLFASRAPVGLPLDRLFVFRWRLRAPLQRGFVIASLPRSPLDRLFAISPAPRELCLHSL